MNLKDSIKEFPKTSGVYRMYNDAGTIVYVGKAVNLRDRVSSYFAASHLLNAKTQSMMEHVVKIEYIETISEFDALLFEASLIKKYKPKYNIIWRDDKHPIYIKITTGEEFPKIFTSRREDDPKSTYFGPFPSARLTRQMLKWLRHIFPYCNRTHDRKPCFYTHLGLCNPCPADIVKAEGDERTRMKRAYRRNVKHIITVLAGNTSDVIHDLEKEMRVHVSHQLFEDAAKSRDRIANLKNMTQMRFTTQEYLENPNLREGVRQQELEELLQWLHEVAGSNPLIHTIPASLSKIECIDISNISGTNAVGSLVVVEDGEPAKQWYRRFKIRTKSTPDDPFMIAEVTRRRFKHTEWTYPNLFVVDGGKSQLGSALKVIQELDVPCMVVGLAKRIEELVFPLEDAKFLVKKIPDNNLGLHVLQRLRDEAHRFAITYHRLLRSKKILKS